MNNQSNFGTNSTSLFLQNKYRCPLCQTVHNVEDCVVEERFIKSQHVGSTVQGRAAVHKFVDTYRYVRICPECQKKEQRTRNIIKIILFGVLPLAFFIKGLINSWDNLDGGEVVALLVIVGMIYLVAAIINGIINRMLDNSVYDIDYDQASADNALLSINEIMDYKYKKEHGA